MLWTSSPLLEPTSCSASKRDGLYMSHFEESWFYGLKTGISVVIGDATGVQKGRMTSAARQAEVQEQVVPLLVSKDGGGHPDCPGCKAAHLQRQNAPVPYKLLGFLGIVILGNCLPISVLYPFVYFMVKDFHVAKSDEDIGYYAGWLGSSFMAGRAVTGLVWGRIADKYGRKSAMYLGITSVLVFNTLFGLSTNFAMALATRFILGSFNGVLGVVKAYASEICSEEHQAVGMSTVGTAWGLGLIIGPSLGGFLAQPAEKFPNVFTKGSIFARFPYLLQALCVSAIAVVALFVIPALPETLHKHHNTVKDEESSVDKSQEEDQSIWTNWPLMASTAVYCFWSLHDIAYTETFSLWSVSPRAYGGLGFTSSNVGAVLGVSGFAMLVAQSLLFPVVARLIGAIRSCRYAALITIPLLVLYPFFNKIHNSTWTHLIVFSASIMKYVLTVAAMTGSFMLINNTVKQRQRGAANGFSVSVVSVFKAIGPAAGGIVFAWAQTRQDAWFLPVISTFEPFLPRSADKLMEEDI
ncbi:probable peptide/nitrate transporter At3g43790 isoform X2 [Selaginella moellendorffii]|uniref:probable peptide/nitrate transporter At3g43790 isoform X2 n=1 Tax=Selaginella moellendorffii TaxID=88036 RepID=UPI000D1C2390|nr:probable peptide/nitrate transporter At3g43790 isoform X2 [Selaginella moellendorffii]|eukprot:XP_024516053.1 probable peptide/nitrate transporter At3g43790 isoform X2 [Selaginella moellendorffii]